MTHVTFIHGIANKPEEERLRKIWLNALADADGIDLGTQGITSSMIYWADVLYGSPITGDLLERNAAFESTELLATQEEEPDMSWRGNLHGYEKEMTDALAARLSFDMLVNDDFVPPVDETGRALERIPLPWFVKRRLMKWLLRDVHHYLFNHDHSPRVGVRYKVQDEIRSRVLRKLSAVQSDKHIVVSHSMGTVIMYDCLMRVPSCPAIDGLMTIGSPLGIDEIQDKFVPEWSRENGFPQTIKGPWVNVYDFLDPVVGFDGNIANDFRYRGDEVIKVINEQNYGPWRHNITNYLSGPKLRLALEAML